MLLKTSRVGLSSWLSYYVSHTEKNVLSKLFWSHINFIIKYLNNWINDYSKVLNGISGPWSINYEANIVNNSNKEDSLLSLDSFYDYRMIASFLESLIFKTELLSKIKRPLKGQSSCLGTVEV